MPVRFGLYVPYFYCCFPARGIIPLALSLPTPVIPPAEFQGCRLLPVVAGSVIQCAVLSGWYGFIVQRAVFRLIRDTRPKNSGYTPGLLLVAAVLVGVAMPLRMVSMPMNALLVEP